MHKRDENLEVGKIKFTYSFHTNDEKKGKDVYKKDYSIKIED